MKLRIATFNVENLFSRPKIMNFPTWAEGQPFLDDYYRLNSLLNKDVYTTADKNQILKILTKYRLTAARTNNKYFVLYDIRGDLLERPRNRPASVKATGRADWLGWVELKSEAIRDEAIINTARVIAEVNPDILVLVEVDDRPALQRFHDQVLVPFLKSKGIQPFPYNMLIDGNDERGIDVGVLSRMPILRMQSHIADAIDGRKIFSRDCPEYYFEIGGGQELVVLPNHFASKGSDRTGERRTIQAERVRQIYQNLRLLQPNVIVAGDLNDYPQGGSLDPLIKQTDLRDAMSLDVYQGFPGTFRTAGEKEKIDYLLLSPQLAAAVTQVDVERRGYYAPRKWESFENINAKTKDRYQASDHHCLWADLQL